MSSGAIASSPRNQRGKDRDCKSPAMLAGGQPAARFRNASLPPPASARSAPSCGIAVAWPRGADRALRSGLRAFPRAAAARRRGSPSVGRLFRAAGTTLRVAGKAPSRGIARRHAANRNAPLTYHDAVGPPDARRLVRAAVAVVRAGVAGRDVGRRRGRRHGPRLWSRRIDGPAWATGVSAFLQSSAWPNAANRPERPTAAAHRPVPAVPPAGRRDPC